jgi:glycosyltransferase involved in cell wall biosynthesis
VQPEPIESLRVKSPFLLYVGNSYPHKNLENLIQAFAMVRQKRPDLSLVLAGQTDYFYQQLQQKVADQTGIIWAGRPSDGQLISLYQQTAAFVFPSLSEGFGLTALEAMSYGAPALAADASCLPEVCGDAAVYFDPRDASDIAAKINDLLSNPQELERLRQAGPARAKQFSWRRMAEQTLAAYEKAS